MEAEASDCGRGLLVTWPLGNHYCCLHFKWGWVYSISPKFEIRTVHRFFQIFRPKPNHRQREPTVSRQFRRGHGPCVVVASCAVVETE